MSSLHRWSSDFSPPLSTLLVLSFPNALLYQYSTVEKIRVAVVTMSRFTSLYLRVPRPKVSRTRASTWNRRGEVAC